MFTLFWKINYSVFYDLVFSLSYKHILSLRTTNHVHPAIRQVLIPLLLYFKEEMPEIFGDVEYDTEFDKKYYAKLTVEDEV